MRIENDCTVHTNKLSHGVLILKFLFGRKMKIILLYYQFYSNWFKLGLEINSNPLYVKRRELPPPVYTKDSLR